MELKDIFKDKPELLNEPEVQQLIRYYELTYGNMSKMLDKRIKKQQEIMEICFASDVFIQSKLTAKKAIQMIVDLF